LFGIYFLLGDQRIGLVSGHLPDCPFRAVAAKSLPREINLLIWLLHV